MVLLWWNSVVTIFGYMNLEGTNLGTNRNKFCINIYKILKFIIFVEKHIHEQLRFLIHHSLHFTVKSKLE